MPGYTLRDQLTMEGAQALIGKRATITFQPDPDEPDRTETHPGTLVRNLLGRPGGRSGYLVIEATSRQPSASKDDTVYVPLRDVREVTVEQMGEAR